MIQKSFSSEKKNMYFRVCLLSRISINSLLNLSTGGGCRSSVNIFYCEQQIKRVGGVDLSECYIVHLQLVTKRQTGTGPPNSANNTEGKLVGEKRK
jgi:hypothetical protein